MIIKGYELNGGHYISAVLEMSTGEDITTSFQDAELSTLGKQLASINDYSDNIEAYPDLTELRALANVCFSPSFAKHLKIDGERNILIDRVAHDPLSDLPDIKAVTDIVHTPEVVQTYKVKHPKQKTVKVMKPCECIEVIDGKAVCCIKEKEVDERVFDYLPMFNEDGTPALDAEGNQRTHQVPVMEGD